MKKIILTLLIFQTLQGKTQVNSQVIDSAVFTGDYWKNDTLYNANFGFARQLNVYSYSGFLNMTKKLDETITIVCEKKLPFITRKIINSTLLFDPLANYFDNKGVKIDVRYYITPQGYYIQL